MARDIKILWLGGSLSANFILDTFGGTPAIDDVNGYNTQVRAWLDANADPGVTYDHTLAVGLGGSHFSDYWPFNRTRNIEWGARVTPNMPVDLVVMESGQGAIIGANFAAFFGYAQQNGDDVGLSAEFLTRELLSAGANAVMLVALPTPSAFQDPLSEVTSYPQTANRIADYVLAMHDIVGDQRASGGGVCVKGVDLRPHIVGDDLDHYKTSGIVPGDRSPIWSSVAAAIAGPIVGAAVKAIPRYILQPDQIGD